MYSLAEGDTAALVRAYTACPAYEQRLAAWYGSPEFAAKQSGSAALRAAVAALFDAGKGRVDTSLEGWWTVFDSFSVHRTYGVGTPMPNVSDAMFGDMRQVRWRRAHGGGRAASALQLLLDCSSTSLPRPRSSSTAGRLA